MRENGGIIEASIDFHGQRVTVRAATETDLEETTRVINAAFATWAKEGVDVGFRATQSVELVRSFLLEDGRVATTCEGKIIATFCVREVVPEVEGQKVSVCRAHKVDRSVLLPQEMRGEEFSRMKLLYPYNLAVLPEWAKKGLGRALLKLIETMAVESKCDGVLLETGINNRWLVDWYERCGFRTIGRFPFPENEAKSIFMLKSLSL